MTDKDAVLKRCAEYILYAQSTINDNTINILPRVKCNVLFDEFQTVTETANAIRLLSSDKAPGSDIIPTEIYETGDQPKAEKPTALCHCM